MTEKENVFNTQTVPHSPFKSEGFSSFKEGKMTTKCF